MKKHNKWRARDLGFVIGLLFDGWTMFHRRRCSSLSFWRVYNLSVPRSPIAERRWTRMSWISRRRWWHDTWLDFSTINSVAEAEITTKPSENVLAMTTLCRRLKFLISCVGSVDSVAPPKKGLLRERSCRPFKWISFCLHTNSHLLLYTRFGCFCYRTSMCLFLFWFSSGPHLLRINGYGSDNHISNKQTKCLYKQRASNLNGNERIKFQTIISFFAYFCFSLAIFINDTVSICCDKHWQYKIATMFE